MITPERGLEEALVTKLRDLKYEYRPDIRDRTTLEANFREKFETLNRVKLTSSEFQRLLGEVVKQDVYEAARPIRRASLRAWWASPLFRPTVDRRCMSMSSAHSIMNSVRSIRPISPRAMARSCLRGRADNCRSI